MEECRQLLQSAERFRQAAAAAEQRRARIRDAMAHATSRIERLRSSHVEDAGYDGRSPYVTEPSADEGNWARGGAHELHQPPGAATDWRMHTTGALPGGFVDQDEGGYPGVGSGAKGSQWPRGVGAESTRQSGADGEPCPPQWRQTPRFDPSARPRAFGDARTPGGGAWDGQVHSPAEPSRDNGECGRDRLDAATSPPRRDAVTLSRESAERVRLAAPVSAGGSPRALTSLPRASAQARALADEANPALRRYILSLESAVAESRAREKRLQAQVGALQHTVRASEPARPDPSEVCGTGPGRGSGAGWRVPSSPAPATPALRVAPASDGAEETDRRLAIQQGLPTPPRWRHPSVHRSPGGGAQYGRPAPTHVPSPPRHQSASALSARVRRLEQSLAGSLRVADLR